MRWRGMVLLAVALLGMPPHAPACNVPVFRYALERWAPDPFEVLVVHRGPLDASQRALVTRLQEAREDLTAPVNLVLERVDLAAEPDPQRVALYEAEGAPPLPCVLVRYPRASRIETTLWSGALTATNLDRLLDSPVRRELVRRLLNGDTAVWLLVESGDPMQDEPAAALLHTELERLPTRLKLPQLTDDADDELRRSDIPYRLGFSLIRVARNDPAETLLVASLVHSEEDLPDLKKPMVFPVFGRGRVLNGLIGAGITANNIEKTAGTLIAACSCDLKALHPGFELLLVADWQGPQQVSSEGESIPIPQRKPEAVALVRGAQPEEPSPRSFSPMVLILAGGLVLVTGGWTWHLSRRSRRSP